MDCRPTIDIKSASTPLFGVLAAVAAELVRGPWELLESCKPGVDTRSGWLAEAEIFFSVLLLAAAASGDDENKATVAAAAAGEVEGSFRRAQLPRPNDHGTGGVSSNRVLTQLALLEDEVRQTTAAVQSDLVSQGATAAAHYKQGELEPALEHAFSALVRYQRPQARCRC